MPHGIPSTHFVSPLCYGSAHRLPHVPRRRLVSTSLSPLAYPSPNPGAVPGLVVIICASTSMATTSISGFTYSLLFIILEEDPTHPSRRGGRVSSHLISTLTSFQLFTLGIIQASLILLLLNQNFHSIHNIHLTLLHGAHLAAHEVIDDYCLLAVAC